jgi:hypothetical protein
MKKLSGGGITMSKNVSPPVRTGSPSKATSPCAASQLGQSTAFKKENVEVGPGGSRVPLGNEVALNVQGGGPGKGRETFRSGTQGTHGPTVAGEPRQPGTADRGSRAILGGPGSKS